MREAQNLGLVIIVDEQYVIDLDRNPVRDGANGSNMLCVDGRWKLAAASSLFDGIRI